MMMTNSNSVIEFVIIKWIVTYKKLTCNWTWIVIKEPFKKSLSQQLLRRSLQFMMFYFNVLAAILDALLYNVIEPLIEM